MCHRRAGRRSLTEFTQLLMIPRSMTKADERTSIDPHYAAERSSGWVGRIPVSAFERLAPLIGNPNATADVELAFEPDDNGLVRVRGVVSLDAVLECQRCLKDVRQKILAVLDMRLTSSEEKLNELMPVLDIMVIDPGPVPIVEIVEDDLIMSIPASVCATEVNCPNAPQTLSADKRVGEELASRPFAGLQALKNVE